MSIISGRGLLSIAALTLLGADGAPGPRPINRTVDPPKPKPTKETKRNSKRRKAGKMMWRP